jgi:hypothetical protein
MCVKITHRLENRYRAARAMPPCAPACAACLPGSAAIITFLWQVTRAPLETTIAGALQLF